MHHPYTYPQPPCRDHISSPDSITWEDMEEMPIKQSIKVTVAKHETLQSFPSSFNEFVPDCYLETDSEPSAPVPIKESGPVWKWPHDLRLVRSIAELKPVQSKLARRKEAKRRFAVGWADPAKLSTSVSYPQHTLPPLPPKPMRRQNEVQRLRTKTGLGMKTQLLDTSVSREEEANKKRSVFPLAVRKPSLRRSL